jgi:hypothetical protein
VRGELGDKPYRRENILYRDLNRKLSDVRDSAALTEILDKLKERFTEELAPDAFDSIDRQRSIGRFLKCAVKYQPPAHVS